MANQNFRVKNGLEVGVGGTILYAEDTGNVGIGLTNPQVKLEIRSSADAPTLTWNGSGQTIIGDTVNQLAIGRVNSNPFGLYLQGRASNSAARDILLNPVGGDVGIGTDNPSQKLDVNGATRFRGAIYDNNNAVGAANSVLSSTGSGVQWISVSAGSDADTLDGLDSSQFLRSDTADVSTGNIAFNGTLATFDPPGGGTGTDTATDVALGLASGHRIVGWSDGYIRTLLEWNGSSDIEIGQSGTSLINGINLLPGSSGVAKVNGNTIWHAGNDGTGSGLDADTVDGIQAASFLRSDANDTASGEITLTSTGNPLTLNAVVFNNTEPTSYYTGGTGTLAFDENFFGDTSYGTGSYDPATVFTGSNGGGLLIRNEDGWGAIFTTQNTRWASTEWANLKIGSNQVWHAGNDGSGSGLDADTLDGINSGSFLRSDAADSASGVITLTNTTTSPKLDITGQAGAANYNYILRAYNDTGAKAVHFVNGSTRSADGGANTYTIRNDGGSLRLGKSSYSTILEGSGDLTYNTNEVWHAGNDGSGSGLDADTLDGINSGSFLRSDADDTFSGQLTGSGTISVTGGKIECGRTSGSVAMTVNDGYGNANLCFNHTTGIPDVSGSSCRIETGVDNTTGVMVFEIADNVTAGVAPTMTQTLKLTTSTIEYGGNTVWHAGNDGSGSGLDADTLDGAQPSVSASNSTIVQRHSSGYIYANYFNTTPNDVTSGITKIVCETGNDGFMRHATDDAVRSFINSPINMAREAGWVPAYSNSTESTVIWNFDEHAVQLGPVSSGGAAFKAIRMRSGDQVRISLQMKGSVADTDGVYIRIYFYNGNLPNGKTHVSNSASYSLVQEDSSGDTGWHENSSIATTYTNYQRTYTAPADGYMSIVVLNWSGYSGNLYIKEPDIQFQKVYDANLLDGINSGSFLRSDASDTATGNITISKSLPKLILDSPSSGDDWTSQGAQISLGESGGGSASLHLTYRGNGYAYLGMGTLSSAGIPPYSAIRFYYNSNDIYFYSNPSIAGNTNWHAGNDGSGSGLDADLLDGLSSGSFLRSDASDTSSQRISFQANATSNWDTIATSTGSQGSIEVYNSGAGNDAFMAFHTGGDFACYFGLDADTNDLSVGGWSMGANKYRVWHAGNDGSGSGLDADTLDGINSGSFLRSDASDTATGTLTVRDIKLSAGYHLQRSDHHSGHLEGSYNSVGANSYKTNPIYSIGSNYNPNDDTLNNFYGIGYSHTNASFISFTGASGWGLYAAADGDARIYLCASNGVISSTGAHYVGSNEVWHAGNDGSGSGLDADSLDGYTWTSSGKNLRGTNIYADDWFRNYNSGEGLYNEANVMHWYSDSNTTYRIRSNQSSVRISFATSSNTTRAYLYADTGSSIGFLNSAGQWGLRYLSADGNSPNWYFREESNETWTGNPGSDIGKIEYHSNRFYIAAGSNSTYVCQFRRSGSDVCRIENNGSIVSSGTVTANSDIKLKTNIKTIDNAIAKVLQLRGVEYDRLDMDNEHQIGVIAQEVEKVIPEVVKDNVEYDPETGEKDVIKSVNYGNMVALLIEAVKEQQNKIDEYGQMIREQQNKIDELEQIIKDK